jgi:hypothetical protein
MIVLKGGGRVCFELYSIDLQTQYISETSFVHIIDRER